MPSLPEELAREVRGTDWSQFECACSPATDLPEMWDRFVAEGDPDWEFGNELCHQGTLYTAIFPLAAPLMKLAKSEHPSRSGALAILGAVLRSTGGTLAYRKSLSETFSQRAVPNPFAPGESIEGPPQPSDEEVEREAKRVRELKDLIESELPCWLQLAESADDATRYAALDLLGGITYHDDQELAEEAIREAYESAAADDRARLAWLIDEMDEE